MSMHPFSPEGRRAALAAMNAGRVDLLVIGGGITGCGLAREAARQGLLVALVEKVDFAYGTSSRSSKLVHGGLRYLAQGDLALVREAGRERDALHAIAPHLTHPVPFVFPVHQGESLAVWRAVFWLLDRLTGARGAAAHRPLSAAEVRGLVTGLREPLQGGVLYGEYVTDDARLTLENALDAALQGALVANHAAVTGLLCRSGRVEGALVQDRLEGGEYAVKARMVVNATGPWATETLRLGGFAAPARLLPSKGIHLIFPSSRLPVAGAVVLRAPSGRQGFAVRRWQWVYVGTTDVAHQGPLETPSADPEAVDELLSLAQACFPGLELTGEDVAGTWAGLRPLLARPGQSPRDSSRHDAIWRGPDGLYTVTGGKLTIYRRMAQRVLSRVAADLGFRLGKSTLAPLPGAAHHVTSESELCRAGAPTAIAHRLAWLYGGRAQELLRLAEADPTWLEPLAPGVPALRGEVKLALEQEMALTLADFLDRRSSLRLFSADHGLAAAGAVAAIMGDRLCWSAAERSAQVQTYRNANT